MSVPVSSDRARRPLLAALLAAVLATCGDGSAAAGEGEPVDPNGGAVPVPAAPVDAGNAFDPADLGPGDTVLGLTVTDATLERALEDSIWVGSVTFAGDLVLHGIYQPHVDWPQVELPCLHVIQPASIARIPRFPADAYAGPAPKTWFCFDNPELAIELLGAPEPPREIVVAVDRYTVRHELSDVFDTAELAEVIEIGPAATATLREP